MSAWSSGRARSPPTRRARGRRARRSSRSPPGSKMPSSTCWAAARRRESPLAGRPTRGERAGAAVVEARELTKRFGDFTAADRITFRIGRGEIFGLLGPNGAGKSTTFKMMCGLLAADLRLGPRGGSSTCIGATSSARGAARLHGPEVLALRRPERAAEPRLLRRHLRSVP